MKRFYTNLILPLILVFSMSSCYTYTVSVGSGAQGTQEVKRMNPYFINGLVPGNVSDPKDLAGDAENYDVTIKHTFIDLLIGVITFGIFSPTSTIVTK